MNRRRARTRFSAEIAPFPSIEAAVSAAESRRFRRQDRRLPAARTGHCADHAGQRGDRTGPKRDQRKDAEDVRPVCASLARPSSEHLQPVRRREAVERDVPASARDGRHPASAPASRSRSATRLARAACRGPGRNGPCPGRAGFPCGSIATSGTSTRSGYDFGGIERRLEACPWAGFDRLARQEAKVALVIGEGRKSDDAPPAAALPSPAAG